MTNHNLYLGGYSLPRPRLSKRRQRYHKTLPEEHPTRFSARLQGLEADQDTLPIRSRDQQAIDKPRSSAGTGLPEDLNPLDDNINTNTQQDSEVQGVDHSTSESGNAETALTFYAWISSYFSASTKRMRKRRQDLPEEHPTRFSARLQGLEADQGTLPIRGRNQQDIDKLSKSFAEVLPEEQNPLNDDVCTNTQSDSEVSALHQSNDQSANAAAALTFYGWISSYFSRSTKHTRKSRRQLPEEHPSRVSARLKGLEADPSELPVTSRRRRPNMDVFSEDEDDQLHTNDGQREYFEGEKSQGTTSLFSRMLTYFSSSSKVKRRRRQRFLPEEHPMRVSARLQGLESGAGGIAEF